MSMILDGACLRPGSSSRSGSVPPVSDEVQPNRRTRSSGSNSVGDSFVQLNRLASTPPSSPSLSASSIPSPVPLPSQPDRRIRSLGNSSPGDCFVQLNRFPSTPRSSPSLPAACPLSPLAWPSHPERRIRTLDNCSDGFSFVLLNRLASTPPSTPWLLAASIPSPAPFPSQPDRRISSLGNSSAGDCFVQLNRFPPTPPSSTSLPAASIPSPVPLPSQPDRRIRSLSNSSARDNFVQLNRLASTPPSSPLLPAASTPSPLTLLSRTSSPLPAASIPSPFSLLSRTSSSSSGSSPSRFRSSASRHPWSTTAARFSRRRAVLLAQECRRWLKINNARHIGHDSESESDSDDSQTSTVVSGPPPEADSYFEDPEELSLLLPQPLEISAQPVLHRWDAVGLGQAMVDFSASVTDDFLRNLELVKGTRKVVNHEERGRVIQALDGCSYKVTAGGSLSNTLGALARLGLGYNGANPLHVAMAGSVGSDALGDFYRTKLQKANLHLLCEPIVGGTTGTVIVCTTPDAQRTMLSYQGMSSLLNFDEDMEKQISTSRVLVVEGYLWELSETIETIERTCRKASDQGVLVAVTASDVSCVNRHREKMLQIISSTATILFTNADEARALLEAPSSMSPSDAALILNKQCPMVSVTDGPQGSYIAFEGEVSFVEPASCVPVDTCGAGDAYAAGFLYGLLMDLPDLKDICNLAARVAAVVVGQQGPRLKLHDARVLATSVPRVPAPREGSNLSVNV